MRILYLYDKARGGIYDDYMKGRGPDDFLYGLNHIRDFGARADFSDRGFGRAFAAAMSPAKLAIAKALRTGFEFPQALRLYENMKDYDALITTNDHNGLPVSLMGYAGLLKTPQVYLSMSMSSNIINGGSMLRSFFRKLLSAAGIILTLSDGDTRTLVERLGLPEEKVRTTPFGVDTDFFRPMNVAQKDYITAFGKNHARDYGTLFDAVKGTGQKLIASVSRENMKGIGAVPPNVSIYYHYIPYPEYKRVIASSLFSVVPLKDADLPVGHSTIMDVMAMGKAVVITRNNALFDNGLRDFKDCVFVRPHDPTDMAEKMTYLRDNPGECRKIGKNARKVIESRFTSRIFARRLYDAAREVSG